MTVIFLIQIAQGGPTPPRMTATSLMMQEVIYAMSPVLFTSFIFFSFKLIAKQIIPLLFKTGVRAFAINHRPVFSHTLWVQLTVDSTCKYFFINKLDSKCLRDSWIHFKACACVGVTRVLDGRAGISRRWISLGMNLSGFQPSRSPGRDMKLAEDDRELRGSSWRAPRLINLNPAGPATYSPLSQTP